MPGPHVISLTKVNPEHRRAVGRFADSRSQPVMGSESLFDARVWRVKAVADVQRALRGPDYPMG